MIIDQAKLISLLAEKTGQPEEQVEQQLNLLQNEIRESTEAGDSYHISEFGTFSGQNGSLQFEPDEQLKTEINQKYAGMKPIELMEAFKDSSAGVPVHETTDEQNIPVEDEQEDADEDIILPSKEEIEAEVKRDDVPPQPAEEPEDEEEPATPAPVPASPEKEEKEKKAQPESEKKPKQKKKVAAKKSSRRKKFKKKRGYGERKRSTAGSMVFAAIVLVAILIGGWLVYANGLFDRSGGGNSAGVPADTTNQRSGVAAANMQDSTEQSGTNNVSGNNASRQQTSKYGLHGTATEEGRDGFTIVIHSFRYKSTLEPIADSLKNQNFRTILIDGQAKGSVWWRLGLGQFATEDDARAALSQLPEQYRQDHFITEIQ